MVTNLKEESSLNKNQANIVNHKDGPLLVIAGPGSGKTKTLVERTVNLIRNGVNPSSIFISTFTNKAAKELLTRISNRLLEVGIDVNLNEIYMGTLHSIFIRMLEEYRDYTRLKRSYRILDDFDLKFLIFRNINKFQEIENSELILGDKINYWNKAGNLIYYLSILSEECLDINELLKSKNPGIKALGELFNLYLKTLEEENSLDFSTIQSEIFNLLESNKKVLDELQSKIEYFMIDEYQDTNTIQEKILLLLSNKKNNICVVGDDDQSLYRFRGATVRNILEFEKNFPKVYCKIEKLEINYRSHPKIIDFYNKWVSSTEWKFKNISYRHSKNILPDPDKTFNYNESVFRVSTNKETDENWFDEVYTFIKYLEINKIIDDYNQIAFLFRSVKNDRVIAMANYLEERGIKIFSPRSALFFEREEVKLILGCLIFIFPDLSENLKWNKDAHLQIWDYYEACKKFFADEIRKDKEKNKDLLKWVQKKSKYHFTLQEKTTYAFAALVYQMLEFPMFSKYLDTELSSNKNDLRASYNIALLTKLLFKFEYLYNISIITRKDYAKTMKNLFNVYLRYIIDGGIEEYEDFDEYAPSGCISFMTFHQSKGLEFPIVFVGSLNGVPSKENDSVKEILQKDYFHKPEFEPSDKTHVFDFWRLYYTAFSRAQNLLILTTREQEGRGKNPSKYLTDLYYSFPKWKYVLNDLALLRPEKIKPVNLKHEYSFTSHILLYENCPLQYKFYKELEFTEVRTGGVLGGSLLHQTIEDIHKAVLKGDEKSLTDENIKNWFDTNYYLLSKQQRAYLHQGQIDSLFKQILRYRNSNKDKWDRIKEAEVEVSFVKENYILKGKIDLIKGKDDTVELIDFKSGDKPDVNSKEEKVQQTLDQYQRQLEVYAHLVEKKTGEKVSKMHLYYPKEESGSPVISFDYNDSKINNTISTFSQVVKKIENYDYDMSHIVKSEKQCGDCDMRFYCNPKQYFE
ncbi:MAG: ATP-dependent helicase [Bacteroidota bacterium]|nr:ATP-dependent helicase [Bacteroidota bacterium]